MKKIGFGNKGRMIKNNNDYKVRCPYCGCQSKYKFKKSISGNVNVNCLNCKKQFILNQNALQRQLNNIKALKQSIWYKKVSQHTNRIYMTLVWIVAVFAVLLWGSELLKGRIWFPITW
ncbi:MAG: hypothetical protein KAJ14_16020 [Candidatus Omnitrophica bacterium]|nr:hypothetical protein [Candidatus Omnitrophota bacterium]